MMSAETLTPWDPTPELAIWAHAWAGAATEIYHAIEEVSMPDAPATEIGRRDNSAMALVDCVRNVVRGAERILGPEADLITKFNDDHPQLTSLRDRFEHYENYLQGTGVNQRTGRRWRGEPLHLTRPGIRITMSSGGSASGHEVTLEVTERDDNDAAGEVTYVATTRDLTVAGRTLARDLLSEVGLLDEVHATRCSICADVEGL